MASPSRLIQAFPSDQLFATPTFDDLPGGGAQDPEFSYFESLDSAGDSYMLDGVDYSQTSWDFPSKDRANALIDPSLAGPFAGPTGLDFGGNDAMFVSQELTPPPSAIEVKPSRGWPTRKEASTTSKAAARKLPTIDTHTESNEYFARNHGQITPPMSSKSPESEIILDTIVTSPTRPSAAASKRGRKPTAKAAAAKQDGGSIVVAPTKQAPAKASRKGRKTKAEAVEAEEEEESQTEEAKAKRARFLERNRQAAFTCRQRKKQWARDLEDRHRNLERDNQNLKIVLGSLKDEFRYLRQQVVAHTTCNCTGAREYIQRSSRALEGESSAACNSSCGEGEESVALSTEPGSDSMVTTAATSAELEQALRDSLEQFDPELSGPTLQSKALDGLDFVHEGAELDGMTL